MARRRTNRGAETSPIFPFPVQPSFDLFAMQMPRPSPPRRRPPTEGMTRAIVEFLAYKPIFTSLEFTHDRGVAVATVYRTMIYLESIGWAERAGTILSHHGARSDVWRRTVAIRRTPDVDPARVSPRLTR